MKVVIWLDYLFLSFQTHRVIKTKKHLVTWYYQVIAKSCILVCFVVCNTHELWNNKKWLYWYLISKQNKMKTNAKCVVMFKLLTEWKELNSSNHPLLMVQLDFNHNTIDNTKCNAVPSINWNGEDLLCMTIINIKETMELGK